MADSASDLPTATDSKPEQSSTRPADADTSMTDVPTEVKPVEGAAEPPKAEEGLKDTETKSSTVDTNGATEPTEKEDKDVSEVANGDDAIATNGATQPAKEKKRKSVGGAPDHKGKKLNRKKSTIDLHLDCKPGEYYWAKTKGNPAWPSIICDEDMLPDTLLARRPVSAARADGTIRDDFAEGGKNAKDRRHAIMFLGTNEFAWQVNTDLRPLELSEVKDLIAKGQGPKMTKKLWEAYEVCVEEHDLDYFKKMLDTHYEAAREDERKIAEAEAKKKEAEEAAKSEPKTPAKAKKEKGKRKSKAAADDDLEMPDAEEEGDDKKVKASNKKKRKVPDTESEEKEKPAKTPKTTLKIKAPKEPQEESAKKTPKTKAKKQAKGSDEEEPAKVEAKPVAPVMSEEELRERTRKNVLWLRHRFQKGFLARDSEPKEEEMAGMAEHFKNLEEYKDLEPELIKVTKIHKVLRAIIKLGSIPKDEEYNFKQRSHELLNHWNSALNADPSAGDAEGESSKTNGVKHDEDAAPSKTPEKKEEETKTEAPATKAEDAVAEESSTEEAKPTSPPKQASAVPAIEA